MRLGYAPGKSFREKIMSLPFQEIPKEERWETDTGTITHGISLYHFGIKRLPVPNDDLAPETITPPGFRKDFITSKKIRFQKCYTFLEVDIHKIVPSQQFVSRDRILQLMMDCKANSKPIQATLIGVYPWIIDGHHRLALRLALRYLKRCSIYARLNVPVGD